jgi:hypothetical protein
VQIAMRKFSSGTRDRQKIAKSVSNASERVGFKLEKNVVVSVLKLNKNDKTVHFKSAYKMKINSIQILFLNNF